ncbi:MAG: hypothetical protein IPL49_03200 [Saprospirales bacterium]|nr:hypothetical protein [Saprospirales bacterium]
MPTFLSRLLAKIRSQKSQLPPSGKEDDKSLAFREQLQKLISENRMDAALELLVKAGNKDAILLKRQYEDAKTHFDKGRITYQEWSLTQARIAYAITNME